MLLLSSVDKEILSLAVKWSGVLSAPLSQHWNLHKLHLGPNLDFNWFSTLTVSKYYLVVFLASGTLCCQCEGNGMDQGLFLLKGMHFCLLAMKAFVATAYYGAKIKCYAFPALVGLMRGKVRCSSSLLTMGLFHGLPKNCLYMACEKPAWMFSSVLSHLTLYWQPGFHPYQNGLAVTGAMFAYLLSQAANLVWRVPWSCSQSLL